MFYRYLMTGLNERASRVNTNEGRSRDTIWQLSINITLDISITQLFLCRYFYSLIATCRRYSLFTIDIHISVAENILLELDL